jgi:ankyrin repeat protein
MEILDAVEFGHVEKVKKLIEECRSLSLLLVNGRHHDRWTFLHYAANNGHADIVEVLLVNEADPEAETYEGTRSLHIASLRGNKEVAEVLINRSANINAQDKSFHTPIHYAAENGHKHLVKLFLDHGADTTLKNFRGMTPIDITWDFEIRKLMEDSEVPGRSKSFDEEGYGRISFGKTVLNNARADLLIRSLRSKIEYKIKYNFSFH